MNTEGGVGPMASTMAHDDPYRQYPAATIADPGRSAAAVSAAASPLAVPGGTL